MNETHIFEDAASVTKKSKSNLAFAFMCIPKERRADMVTFYAYCRQVDDIADDTNILEQERHQQLDTWENVLKSGKLVSNCTKLGEKWPMTIS